MGDGVETSDTIYRIFLYRCRVLLWLFGELEGFMDVFGGFAKFIRGRLIYS